MQMEITEQLKRHASIACYGNKPLLRQRDVSNHLTGGTLERRANVQLKGAFLIVADNRMQRCILYR